jgi:hypothetical protein
LQYGIASDLSFVNTSIDSLSQIATHEISEQSSLGIVEELLVADIGLAVVVEIALVELAQPAIGVLMAVEEEGLCRFGELGCGRLASLTNLAFRLCSSLASLDRVVSCASFLSRCYDWVLIGFGVCV